MAETAEAQTTSTNSAVVDDSTSIAEHEQALGVTPAASDQTERDEQAPVSRERDDRGKFKPRGKSAATPIATEPSEPAADTVESLSKRLRDLETENTALKSARTAPPRATESEKPAESVAAAPKTDAPRFPTFVEFIAQPGNAEKTFEDFLDARSDWHYELRRATERAEEAGRQAETQFREHLAAYSAQLDAVQKKYPDFQTVMASGSERLQTSKVVERAVLEVGPEVAYYLATHDDERRAVTEDTLYVGPDNPAFAAAVASMKRYFKTLVTADAEPAPKTEQRPRLVPKPPTPTRTGGMPPRDEPPDDDAGLAAHEAYYGPKRGRA